MRMNHAVFHILQFHIILEDLEGSLLYSSRLLKKLGSSTQKSYCRFHKSTTKMSAAFTTLELDRDSTELTTARQAHSPVQRVMGRCVSTSNWIYKKCADVVFPRVEYNVHSYSFTAVSLRWFDIREICIWLEAGWNKNNPLVKQLLSLF